MGASQNLAALRKNIELARWDYLTGSRPWAKAALDITQMTMRQYELLNFQQAFGSVFRSSGSASSGDGFETAERRLMDYNIRHKPRSRSSAMRGLLDNLRTIEAWGKARAANDFDLVAGRFGAAMRHEYSEARYKFTNGSWPEMDERPESERDVALDSRSEGLRNKHMHDWERTLRPFCQGLLEKERTRQATQRYLYDDAFHMPAADQETLVHGLLRRMGYDESCGKIAPAPHPICLGRNDDVRIGYTIDEKNFLQTLLSAAHEGGHAFYRQNLPEAQKNMLSGDIAGNTVDEAMALLFENAVFRTKAGAAFIYDMVAREVGEPYKSRLSPQMIFKHMMKLEPRGIRAKADEIRYPLDILHRYSMMDSFYKGAKRGWTNENKVIWNALSEKMIGIDPEDDNHGILQDVHIYAGEAAWLPMYLPGRLAASQIVETFFEENPKQRKVFNEYGWLDRDLKALDPLKSWLKEKICDEGARLKPFELIEHVTGKPLSPDAYMAHVTAKYTSAPLPQIVQTLHFD